jgi:pimeloyl-ACP methyl ester carboxylesterase
MRPDARHRPEGILLIDTTEHGGHAAVGDARIEYRWFGHHAAERETLVMLHEGLGSVSMWKDFPERLAQATGLGVLAYSRQGYGGSSRLDGKREPDYMHREGQVVLPALLDALSIEAPILLGHSDGASIAILYAAAFPARARALILEAPHVFVEPMTVTSIAGAKAAYERTDLSTKLARYHADVDSAFWGWNDIWLDPRFLDWNIEPCLAAIDCPVLMIQGLQDEYGSTAQLDAISASVAGAETVLLDHCGHSPHRDQPDLTLAAIGRFLQAHRRGPPG